MISHDNISICGCVHIYVSINKRVMKSGEEISISSQIKSYNSISTKNQIVIPIKHKSVIKTLGEEVDGSKAQTNTYTRTNSFAHSVFIVYRLFSHLSNFL